MMYFVRRIFFLAMLLLFSANAVGVGDALTDIFSFKDSSATDEILPPEIAFNVNVDQYSANQLILSWQIEQGYYLYKDKFSVKSTQPTISIVNAVYPAGKLKQDPAFGEVEVYYGQDSALMDFVLTGVNLNEFTVEVGYQGCKEDSVCYPPIKKTLPVSISGFSANTVGNTNEEAVTLVLSEQDSITQKLKDKNLLFNILSFFGFGLLLSLTPCIFPMIPILSGIIVGEGERITRKRALSLSFVYVVAMALTYAVLGVIAGLFSLNLQAASQNIWVLSLFSGVFVFLALSMFGFYELQLPSSIQSKLSSRNSESDRGTLKGAWGMGILSAIIVGPCVAPPLAGALLYISQTGDALLGGLALFALGLGLGVPLLIVGASSGELLPRAGAWMETIKRIFGVIMLGVAIWFLERVLPEPVVLLLWAALFIGTAIFIGALDRIDAGTSHWQRLWKSIGLVLLVYGAVLVVAAATGGGTVLRPFNSLTSVAKEALPFEYVKNLEEFEQRLQQANAEGKPVMLDFYADWCIACIELEKYTYPDPAVQASLKGVTLLKIDVTENNEMDKAFLKHFELFGPPAILFFNNSTNEIKSHRLVGFIKPAPFVKHVQQALSLTQPL